MRLRSLFLCAPLVLFLSPSGQSLPPSSGHTLFKQSLAMRPFGAARPMMMVGSPSYAESPNPLDFGNVPVVQPGLAISFSSLIITNAGTAPLIVSGFSFSGADAGLFCLGPPTFPGDACMTPSTPFSLPVGMSTVPIGFDPTSPGSRSAQLTLMANDAGSPHTINLAGNGIVLPSGFSVSPSGSNSATVTGGQTATYNVMVSSVIDLPLITVACTGAPVAASCNLGPTPFSLNAGSSQIVMISVPTTPPLVSRTKQPSGIHMGWAVAAVFGLVLSVSRRRFPSMVSMACLCVLLGGILACGNPDKAVGGTPVGTYTLTVTATAAGTSNSTPLTLIVQ